MKEHDADWMWKDIEKVFFSENTLQYKYTYYYRLLRRICIELVAPLATNYTDFFSRLQAVCRLTEYPLRNVDTFRWRARRVMDGKEDPREDAYLVDTKAFMEALARFTNTRIPSDIIRSLPDSLTPPAIDVARNKRRKKCRFVAVGKDDRFIHAVSRELPGEEVVKVDFTANEHTLSAALHIAKDTQFNAVDFTVDAEGVVYPLLIVVNPDFLLDISTLTACVKPYGDSPFNYFLKKFEDVQTSAPILLGQLANQFLDDCINSKEADYKSSMKKAFRDYALEFSACKDINRSFFEECERQFLNIRQIVSSFFYSPDFAGDKSNVLLEPSFFCETLGLQGRMDFLQGDYKCLIELKSGKMDEYQKRPREEHLLQMILYKEVLHYNLGINRLDVCGNLLYSKYPLLQEQRSVADLVREVMTLRNNIVVLEQHLCEGYAQKYVSLLTPEKLRRKAVGEKLWQQWCKPAIRHILEPLQRMDELTADYFYTFLQFVEREQFLAKIGDGKVDSTRGMASLWNADIDAKRENGDIIDGLKVVDILYDKGEAVEAVVLCMPEDGYARPNFRVGDAVILYQRENADDTAVNRQIVRCNVEECTENRLSLQLRYKQRNAGIFKKNSAFAVEHDYIESTFHSLYTGLFSLVTAPASRRELLLCRRLPETDSSVTLRGTYLNRQIDELVLRAKQAKDYFLLVGPPGTGKTSVALKSMVEEFVSEGHTILLLAYTNRAVDEICAMLDTVQGGRPDYIRMGKELMCMPCYRDRLMVNVMEACTNRQQIVERLSMVRIVVGTVASVNGARSLFRLKHFDVAIFDEASQILEPQILGLLCEHDEKSACVIDKFIMIGDHKQLPAVVVQKDEQASVSSGRLREIGLDSCANSLFERLHNFVSRHEDCSSGVVGFLNRQGRMHPDIAGFASSHFYSDNLCAVPVRHQMSRLPYTEYTEDEKWAALCRVVFIDIPLPDVEDRQPKSNMKEAEKVCEIVKTLISLSKKNGVAFCPSKQIGVIVPFRRQIAIVRRLLECEGIESAKEMLIDTVERFQGSQRDVIIYATTITQPYELDILSNMVVVDGELIDRKLNVAVTRAREQLFILGNRSLLLRNPIYKELVIYTENLCVTSAGENPYES
ncbi:MAG: DNA2/NAM7 family helicase [Bacteroides sp.]|nr:DNA2/NAM7 family helicase [Roseburia sp.]MCM1346715.1 DNA2/NAM7 family helicase [Bacteroides sp.]MCM1421460.1 DNA2/NAM7 family helicase [Bacteroides sp.]